MSNTTVPTVTMGDGAPIPQLGFGVWQVKDELVTEPVLTALEVGYRHIDTAAIYGNEAGVGRALAESGIARDELFITSKLWNDSHRSDDARKAIETSLTKLGLDYLDLYLIHWPATVKYGDAYIEAWDALQQFKAEGLVRSIGVSNFDDQHLDALRGETPAIDQIEMHPSFGEAELRAILRDRGITAQAYSPLGNHADPRDLELPAVVEAARASGKTPAQVILRWHLQLGNVVIPKSVTPARIAENFDVFDFELSDEHMDAITACEAGFRQGADPQTADF